MRYRDQLPRDVVIFLDFDGVLRSRDSLDGDSFDPAAIARLTAIVRRTGALVVISSSRRIGRTVEDLRRVLASAGFPYPQRVVDKTSTRGAGPLGERRARGHQIQRWLDSHPGVRDFAILDDDADVAHLVDRLVRTNGDEGLQDEHVERVVEMLGGDR